MISEIVLIQETGDTVSLNKRTTEELVTSLSIFDNALILKKVLLRFKFKPSNYI